MPRPILQLLCTCSAFGCRSKTTEHTLWEPPNVVAGRFLESREEFMVHAAAEAEADRARLASERLSSEVSRTQLALTTFAKSL